MMMMPWLSQDEIDDLCAPLTQHAAQIRFMRDELMLTVRTKPNGAPLVMRSHVEQGMNPQPARPVSTGSKGPNKDALIAHFQKAA